MLKLILTTYDYEVIEAHHGLQALELVKSHQFDLIITEYLT